MGGLGVSREEWAFPYLLQRILVSIQRGNTAAVLGSQVPWILMTIEFVML